MYGPGMAMGGVWVFFALAYVGVLVFVLTLVWRIAKAVERIGDALEQRPPQ